VKIEVKGLISSKVVKYYNCNKENNRFLAKSFQKYDLIQKILKLYAYTK